MVLDKGNKAGKKKKSENVPDCLVYEELDGMKVYYRGYKDVLAGKLMPEEIRGYGDVQILLLTIIRDYLQTLFGKNYWLLQGEMGLHISHKTNPSLDLSIYPKKDLSLKTAENKYLKIPPKIVIEVDTKADVASFEGVKGNNYYILKTKKLLEFGVESVIWFFTQDKKVMIATSNAAWQTKDWTDEIEVLGHRFSLTQIIEESEKESN